MCVFYLLPDRGTVARSFADALGGWFPNAEFGPDLAERLAELALDSAEAHAVFADDLPDDEDVSAVLRESFGAEPGDRIIDRRKAPAGPTDNLRPRLAPAC